MEPPSQLGLIANWTSTQVQKRINQLSASITPKVVAIAAAALVVIAIIPIALVYLGPSDDTSLRGIRSAGLAASSARSNGDADRVRLIAEVKAAGDDVIARINSNETNCIAQISQLAAVSTISGTETQTALADGKSRVHLVATSFVHEIQVEESDFSRRLVVSGDTEQLFLSAIAEVRVTALGDGTNHGELGAICQSVLVEVRTKVKPVVNLPLGD
ncbi:MAG: hypothetical protein ACYDAL_13825 [Candidatus Dormibacteraceae bacterium]